MAAPPAPAKPGLPVRLLREPLVHFLILGGLLFAAYSALNAPDAGAPYPTQSSISRQIVINDARIDALTAGFQQVWRRPPTEAEMARLIEDFIREEVLVREARALGLDQGDSVVRQRMRQKMEFLTAAAVDLLDPTDAELATYYQTNAERYRRPISIAFNQVYLGQSPDAETVAATLAAIATGADPADFGEPTLLPDTVPMSGPQQIAGVFGADFARALPQLELGKWQGPVASAYGLHVVRATGRDDGGLPDLDDLRSTVVSDWRRDQTIKIEDARFARLRESYEIVQP